MDYIGRPTESLVMFLLTLLACGNEYLEIDAVDTGSVADEQEEDLAQWDDAELIVLSPESASFISIEEGGDFSAQIVDAEGKVLEFDEIQWTLVQESGWDATGAQFTDTLPVGTHDIRAKAELPNGDRVSYTVGGVLSQSVYAGTYAGNLVVDLISDQFSTACSGAATATVQPDGEVVLGEANCFLSFQGFDIDGVYEIDAGNDLGEVEGQIALDVFGFQVPLDLEGSVSEGGTLTGTFTGDLLGYAEVQGTLELERVTREVGG